MTVLANRALDELLALTDLSVPSQGDVEILGADPVLDTRFRIGETAAGVLAAIGIAAADLWRLRTGRGQKVAVDTRRAAAALRSYTFMSFPEGGAGTDAMADRARRAQSGSTGIYETKDGRFFHTHGSFDREGMLRFIGAEENREAVAAAVAKWDAQDLEDALADAGMCGAMIRPAEEWAGHPHGRALARRPVVEILRIGDSAPEPLPAGARPLDGVRVLDLTRVLAGPTCARTLAEHGADVLRIGARHLPFAPAFVMDTGHGKRSAFLDLKDGADRETMTSLVRSADVFSQGYRPGALARRGFGPDEAIALRPGIVYVSINCYGHDGPFKDRPGWEQLGQSVSGIAHEQGLPGRPRLLPAAACDYTTGYLAALGALVALGRRAREGGSYHVRVSLARTGMWFVAQPRVGRDVTLPDPDACFSDEEAESFTVTSETPFGRMRHLAPVVRMSETPPRWALPAVPLGTHEAQWSA